MSGVLTRTLVPVAALGVCVLAAGCTGSETIISGNANLTVRVEPSPTGPGRYDGVNLGIRSLEVRPNDPTAEAELGSLNIPLNVTSFSGNLASGGFQAAPVSLARGSYRVTRLELTRPTLTDSGSSAPNTGSCAAYFDSVPSLPEANGSVPVPAFFSIDEASLGTTIAISAGSDVAVTVLVDVPALVEAFESAFLCQEPVPPNIQVSITGFDSAGFASALPGLITVR